MSFVKEVRLLPRGNLNACRTYIACLIKRTRLKLISLIRRTRHSPDTAIRRSRVAALQRAIHQKVDARDADVIARGRRDRDVCFARDDSAVRRIGDRDSRWNVIAGRSEIRCG